MSSSYGDENSGTSALQKTSSDQVFPKPAARRLSEKTEFLFPEFTDFCSSPTSVTQTSPSSARFLCKAGQLRPARLQQEPEIQLRLLSRYLPSDQRQPAAPPAARPVPAAACARHGMELSQQRCCHTDCYQQLFAAGTRWHVWVWTGITGEPRRRSAERRGSRSTRRSRDRGTPTGSLP